jgi:hypothetical protein
MILLYACKLFAYIVLMVVIILATSLQVHTTGNIYYVATTGSDNANGSLSTPWATIKHAAQAVVAGDTVYIKAGTYNEVQITVMNSGTSGNYITFQNYGTDIVNINTPTTEFTSIWTHSKSYLQFIGLRFIGTPTIGLDIDGGSYITAKNCYFTNSKSSGIGGSSADHVTIDGCELSGTNTGALDECISLYALTNFEIKNCKVHDPVAADRIGIDAKNGCSNGSIHHNEVYNCGAVGIYIDGYGVTQSNISVYSNKVHNNASAGISVNSESSPANQTNINFYNNLIYNNYLGFTAWATPSFTKTFSLINNTFYHNGIAEIAIYDTHDYNLNCIVRNNIIVGTNASTRLIYYPDYAQGGVTIDHNLFYDAAGYYPDGVNGITYGTNYMLANPLLVDTGDLGIVAGSPAIDIGSPIFAPDYDLIGTSRPQGSGYDIGAYEYVTTSTTPSVTTNADSNK